MLAATDDTGCVTVWDVARHIAARPRTDPNLSEAATHAVFTPTLRAPAIALAFAPDASLAVAGFDKLLRFYDAALSRFLFSVGCPAPVSSLAFRMSTVVLGLTDGSFAVADYSLVDKKLSILSRVRLQLPSSAPSLAVRSVWLPPDSCDIVGSVNTSSSASRKGKIPPRTALQQPPASAKMLPAFRTSLLDQKGKTQAPASPVLPPPISFDTSSNFLESIDEMLSGRGADVSDAALLDADVFSPVSKRTPPARKLASPSDVSNMLPASSEIAQRSISVQDFGSPNTFQYENLTGLSEFPKQRPVQSDTPISRPPTDHLPSYAKHSDALPESDALSEDTGFRLENQADEILSVGGLEESAELQDLQRRMDSPFNASPRAEEFSARGKRVDRPSPLTGKSVENSSAPGSDTVVSPVGSLTSRQRQAQRSPVSNTKLEAGSTRSRPQSGKYDMRGEENSLGTGINASESSGMNTGSLRLDDLAMAQLTSLFRESVKAELDDRLTDLRNDILNIHSEMVVMGSNHSAELQRVVVDRDNTVNRLHDEIFKLRADNDRLRRKYGLG